MRVDLRVASIVMFLAMVLLVLPGATAEAGSMYLQYDTRLSPAGWGVATIVFQGRTTVITNAAGQVVSGVIRYDEFISPVAWGNAQCHFAGGHEVRFDSNGGVEMGTLKDQSSLRMSGSTSTKFFPAGYQVYFDAQGGAY